MLALSENHKLIFLKVVLIKCLKLNLLRLQKDKKTNLAEQTSLAFETLAGHFYI